MNTQFGKIIQFLGIELIPVSHVERLISALGGFISIFLVMELSALLGLTHTPLIIASFGASAVLLFAAPHGAFSQPWPLVGGHLISAFIGVSCFQLGGDTLIAAAVAVALAIAAMHYLRCIHPPGGATALTAVVGGTEIHQLGYSYIMAPIVINAISILILAIVFNYLFTWRRYPLSLKPKPTSTLAGVSHADLNYALGKIGSFIDVTENDLVNIYTLAVEHAQEHSHMPPEQIQMGHYYSNGQYGHHWSIRQVVNTFRDDTNNDMVVYKTVAGEGRHRRAQCTQQSFAKWAKHEVFRDENSWKLVK